MASTTEESQMKKVVHVVKEASQVKKVVHVVKDDVTHDVTRFVSDVTHTPFVPRDVRWLIFTNERMIFGQDRGFAHAQGSQKAQSLGI
ncbi:hypothetical protein Tco_0862230 [Tanacetum coccineum]